MVAVEDLTGTIWESANPDALSPLDLVFAYEILNKYAIKTFLWDNT